MGMEANSLEGFSTSESFLDDIQLKRIDCNSDFSADTLLVSEKKYSAGFSLSCFPMLFVYCFHHIVCVL